MTYIRFQTGGTACRGGPWLCRRCTPPSSSSSDRASGSARTRQKLTRRPLALLHTRAPSFKAYIRRPCRWREKTKHTRCPNNAVLKPCITLALWRHFWMGPDIKRCPSRDNLCSPVRRKPADHAANFRRSPPQLWSE